MAPSLLGSGGPSPATRPPLTNQWRKTPGLARTLKPVPNPASALGNSGRSREQGRAQSWGTSCNCRNDSYFVSSDEGRHSLLLREVHGAGMGADDSPCPKRTGAVKEPAGASIALAAGVKSRWPQSGIQPWRASCWIRKWKVRILPNAGFSAAFSSATCLERYLYGRRRQSAAGMLAAPGSKWRAGISWARGLRRWLWGGGALEWGIKLRDGDNRSATTGF